MSGFSLCITEFRVTQTNTKSRESEKSGERKQFWKDFISRIKESDFLKGQSMESL